MNFRALREEMAKMKAEKEALAENFDTWKRELATSNVQRQPEAPRKSAIEDLPDNDLITGAQLKQLLAEKDAEFRKVQQDQEIFNQEQRLKQQYSDYDEVATKYGVPLLKQEPDLAQAFVSSQNKAAFLYKLGKMQQLSEAPPPAPSTFQPQQVNKAQRILENSKKPGTLSSATQGQQAISSADYFASMSDKDFSDLVTKNLEQV
jgi:tRNA U34 5-carboxymethylaminomethyl modifying enzyme MnmG/GidA